MSLATHTVTAWGTANGVALGQVTVMNKSNEITAIPELLYLLDLAGCLVTIDAMGCQKEIAAQIVAQQGDYLLATKQNHPHLHEDISHLFDLGHGTGRSRTWRSVMLVQRQEVTVVMNAGNAGP